MSDIVWEDPPERCAGSDWGRVARFVAELKRHPGKWAIYSHARSPSPAAYIKRRYPSVEVTTRSGGAPGQRVIYVRWVGEG